jgi:hypothetical protein
MQKSSFFKAAIIFITTAITPIMAMESLTSTEIKKFTVRLSLKEVSQADVEAPFNKTFDKKDEHGCKVLGIEWEKNKNTYVVNWVSIKPFNSDDKESYSWKKGHPKLLPLSSIEVPDKNTDKSDKYKVTFPTSLPASFVKELKKNKITCKNTLFQKPVKFIFELAEIIPLETNLQQEIIKDPKSNIATVKETQNVTSSVIKEIPQLTAFLSLTKMTQTDMENSREFDENDEHECNVLGIKWENNKNTYMVNSAIFQPSDNDKTFLCWRHEHPANLPFSKIANKNRRVDQYKVIFPTSLPAHFVKRLKKEGTITLENTLFADPVTIIIKLMSITKLENILNKLEYNQQEINQEIPTITENPELNKIKEQKNNSTAQQTVTSSQSNIKNYILWGGCVISTIGFIAWLLHHNNKLDLSQITNFIHNLTNK